MPENLRAEGSWRKYVMRHACPASWPDKTIWAEFYYGFVADRPRNVILIAKSIDKHYRALAWFGFGNLWLQRP
jgi:hypothetical protein